MCSNPFGFTFKWVALYKLEFESIPRATDREPSFAIDSLSSCKTRYLTSTGPQIWSWTIRLWYMFFTTFVCQKTKVKTNDSYGDKPLPHHDHAPTLETKVFKQKGVPWRTITDSLHTKQLLTTYRESQQMANYICATVAIKIFEPCAKTFIMSNSLSWHEVVFELSLWAPKPHRICKRQRHLGGSMEWQKHEPIETDLYKMIPLTIPNDASAPLRAHVSNSRWTSRSAVPSLLQAHLTQRSLKSSGNKI